MRSLLNHVHLVSAIAPIAARTDNTAIVSSIIDRRDFESLLFALNIGTNTDADATFAVTMREGDASNLSDGAAVAAADIDGTLALAGFTFADDLECRKIAYCGNKRYVELTITPSGNGAGNIFLSAMAILGHPKVMPTANPPQ